MVFMIKIYRTYTMLKSLLDKNNVLSRRLTIIVLTSLRSTVNKMYKDPASVRATPEMSVSLNFYSYARRRLYA
jgi:hypothetical protein